MIASDTPAEAQLNPLLRRVDWRFLLRNPRPKTSLIFDGDQLAQALTVISERVEQAAGQPHADCDLVVATNPSAKMLHAAWTALEPGGALYTEWTIPIWGRIRRVRRMLQAAGFENVQGYWSWPPPDRLPLLWAPLDARGAWQYLITSRPPDRHRLRHGVRWLERLMAYSLHALGWLTPVCAMAYKPGAEHQSLTTCSLAAWLRAHWLDWQLGPLPRDLSVLLLTGGKRSSNKIVALVFAEPETQPRLVVKLPRVVDSEPGLKREAETLQTVQARRSALLPGVPQVVFYDECETPLMVGETALSGVPLFTQLDDRNYRAWALKATDWLIELSGAPALVSHASWRGHVAEPILKDFQNSFGAILDQRMMRETYSTLAKIDRLPLVCEQRDFSPWNVLIGADGELVVLDWESAEIDGLPVLDLIYFLTYLAFFVEGAMEAGTYLETYRTCWSEQSSTGRVNVECLRRYCEALKLDDTAGPALRLLTWPLHARSEYARLLADAGGTPSEETLRQSLFVSLWEEEAHHRRVYNGKAR